MKYRDMRWLNMGAKSAAMALAVFLSSCATPPSGQPGAAFIAAPRIEGAAASINKDGAWPSKQWWEDFNDPVLSSLVERAIKDSPTIRLAGAKIRRAESQYRLARSFISPEAYAGARLTHNRISEHGLIPASFVDNPYTQGDVFATVTYDLDLWDRAGFNTRAAGRETEATMAEADEARLLLAHSVAQGYFAIANLRESLAVLKSAQTAQDELVKILELRVTAGLDNEAELDRANSIRSAMKEPEEALLAEIRLTLNALSALVGAGPDELNGLAMAKTPQVHAVAVPPNLSLNLLARRPDVRSALIRVEAASERIGAARAGFYPDIRLSALAGFQSLDLLKLLDGTSLLYNLGPAVSLPLFNAGRLEAGLDSAGADYDMAVERYNQTALMAVKEAADQLTLVTSLDSRLKSLSDSHTESLKALKVSERRHTAGLEGKVPVLRASLEALERKRAIVAVERAAISARIGLVKALGGGFVYSAAPKKLENEGEPGDSG